MASEYRYIGIDPTTGRGRLTYTVLDGYLNVVAAAHKPLEEVVELITSYPAVTCAIGSPAGPSNQLLATEEYRERYGLPLDTDTYATFRVCDYELRRRKIGLYRTPIDREDAPKWMKLGWKVYEALHEAGWARYPLPGAQRYLEVHPLTCFAALLGHIPYKKRSFEGRLQRQLLLHDEGVQMHDPMIALEEWTRHRVLAGNLGEDELLAQQNWMEALVAAYTGYLATQNPKNVTRVGDPIEGQIIVPASTLRESYE